MWWDASAVAFASPRNTGSPARQRSNTTRASIIPGSTSAAVCSVITESLGGLPRCVVVEADVCRSDLLVEIEATGESALESV